MQGEQAQTKGCVRTYKKMIRCKPRRNQPWWCAFFFLKPLVALVLPSTLTTNSLLAFMGGHSVTVTGLSCPFSSSEALNARKTEQLQCLSQDCTASLAHCEGPSCLQFCLWDTCRFQSFSETCSSSQISPDTADVYVLNFGLFYAFFVSCIIVVK